MKKQHAMGTLEEKNLHGKYSKNLVFKLFKMFHVIDMHFNNQVKFQAVKEKTISTLFKMSFCSQ